MKKILNLMPLLLLCSCLTTSPNIETTEPPAEPELAIEKGDIADEVDAIHEGDALKGDEVVVKDGVEVVNLKTPDEVKVPSVKPVVIMKTSMGDIKIELDPEKAPVTVKNFLDYVDSKYYNGTIFHRIISNFMIQGGGLTPNMHQKKTKMPIKNEAYNGLSNKRGTVAMARTNIVDSATSQFFINVKDNTFLDHKDKSAQRFGYCVFGKVIDGMDVVDKIKNVKTGTKGYGRDVPVEPVLIKEIVREIK
jgi:peptidyl-prolyl cis-trans isomerase B (cyclophilin B)